MTACLEGGEEFRIKWKGNRYILFCSYGFYNTEKKLIEKSNSTISAEKYLLHLQMKER